ncbi:TlpA family protein disulfide reductase [Paenibacillus sp. CAU 1523]|uniref:TlpA family protein disulfide reductase n=2 Tax=Paenibacillus arenosi TaxID=2774142 RepID=A0ABR9AZM7_9BACL|nr:TlpA family protein disulfide reductase [Paenibacillus arenosi]
MKKNIFIIAILFGLVSWGIYDTIKKNNMKQESLANTEQAKNKVDESSLEVGINQGNLAPDFELKTLEGESIKLSDYRGKKVILNMWATWCPPCKVEMPDMQKIYEKYKDENVTILAVNMTQTEKNVDSIPTFLDEMGITFPVVLDPKSEIAFIYQSYMLPTSYVIDSNGIVQQKITGPMHYEMMEKMITEIN